MTADEEDDYIIAQANEPLDENGTFVHERVTVRRREDIGRGGPRRRSTIWTSAPSSWSPWPPAMIPFLENDDANRALMGSNMQRQAVPLLIPEAPIVGTGIEYKAACDSGVVHPGHARTAWSSSVTADADRASRATTASAIRYKLIKFTRSNQGTCINQRPIV